MDKKEYEEQSPGTGSPLASMEIEASRETDKRFLPAVNKSGWDPSESEICDGEAISVDVVTSLVVDLWKISQRAKGDSVGKRVVAACERAQDRLQMMGFTMEDLTGRPYDTNMRAQILGHDKGGAVPPTVSECLSPAIYYKGKLVRKAEIITKGAEGDHE